MYILVLLSFVIFHIISHCCPYGLMLVVLLVLALAASMTTWFAAFDCSFYEVNTLGIGLWTTQDPFLFGQVTVCYGWDNTIARGMKQLLDTPMKVARSLSFTACVFSVMIFPSILLLSCVSMSRKFIRTLAILMILNSMLVILCLVSRTSFFVHAFTLVSNIIISLTIHSVLYYSLSFSRALAQVALTSDLCNKSAGNCEIGAAGKACITASVLWLISGCATLALQKKPDPVSKSATPEISEMAVPDTEQQVESETAEAVPDTEQQVET
jgi:hypothetical protein